MFFIFAGQNTTITNYNTMKRFLIFLMMAAMLAFIACTPKEQPKPDPSKDTTEEPSKSPSDEPSEEPSQSPSEEPSDNPSDEPTEDPSAEVSDDPSIEIGAVSIGDKQFDTIQAAVDAAESGDLITLNEVAYKENVKISKDVIIEGNENAVLTGSIEMTGCAAGIKTLTIEPDGSVVPENASGWDLNPYAIRINKGGHGAVIYNVSIDMTGLRGKSGTGIFAFAAEGDNYDIIEACHLFGAGERVMQLYGAKVVLRQNVIDTPYASYGVRIGETGADVQLTGNTFISENEITTAVHLNNLTDSRVLFGEGSGDDNTYSEQYVNKVAGSMTNSTIEPYTTLPVSNSEPVEASVTITPIWTKPHGDAWFGTDVPDVTTGDPWAKDWYRNVAMDDTYVYVSASSKTAAGIYAIEIGDPTNVIPLNVDGIEGGTFFTNCVRTIADGDKTYILAGNLSFSGMWAGSNDTQVLKLYVWKDRNGAPEKILEFPIPSDINPRLGDKFEVWGDWNDGLIFFKNYNSDDYADVVYVFTLKNGVVDATPSVKRLNDIPEGWKVGSVSAYYPYTKDSGFMAGWNAMIPYVADGSNYKCQPWTAGGYLDYPLTSFNHGVNFFTLAGEEYVAYVHIRITSMEQENNAVLNVFKMNGSYQETFAEAGNLTSYVFAEGGVGEASLNGAGDLALRVIGGNAYAVLSVPNVGFGVYIIEAK